jgi:hypothetical protein
MESDRPAMEMIEFENMGKITIGCGKIHNPTQNMNSDEENIA